MNRERERETQPQVKVARWNSRIRRKHKNCKLNYQLGKFSLAEKGSVRHIRASANWWKVPHVCGCVCVFGGGCLYLFVWVFGMCFCRVSVCLSVRVCVCCHSSCRVLSRMMNVQASVSFSSRVCEQNIYLCASCVCANVCAKVCVPLTSIDMGVYPLRP